MKIVLAPNAFKGSASAPAAAAAMARGVRQALPACVVEEVPVSDGGDGLHELTLEALGGEEVASTVTGPRFDPVPSGFVVARERGLAVIETARASGLVLLDGRALDPTEATTLGTGELIRAALDEGLRHLIVGIGGSATNDGGVGMAAALGWRFKDAQDRDVTPVGGELTRIVTIDDAGRDPRLAETRIEVACDVDNPLCGPRGAAIVYGPQKGATPAQVTDLDCGLAHLADLVAATTDTDDRDRPGAGAAGGLGFGLRVFAGATLRPGTEIVFELVRLDEHLAGADLVITGEGRIDEQTLMGKAPAAVAMRARARGIPCYALTGSIDVDIEALRAVGIGAAFKIGHGPRPLEEAMAQAPAHLERAAERAVREFASDHLST